MRISDWSSDVCSSDLVSLSVGQIHKLAGGRYLHLDLRMETRKFGEVGHEQVRCEGRRQCHPQKPAHALIAPEDARLQQVRRRFHLVREFEELLARSRQAEARGRSEERRGGKEGVRTGNSGWS